MKLLNLTLVAAALLSFSFEAKAETYRAQHLSTEMWSQLVGKNSPVKTVEFRQGDEIPVSFSSEGDLLETAHVGISYVKVKRTFWLQLKQNGVSISLDGSSFKPISEVLSGSIEAGAGGGQTDAPVNAINLVMKAFLK